MSVGPASYQIPMMIGQAGIAESQIKACPRFSFGRSETHRTIDSTYQDGTGRSKSPHQRSQNRL